MKDSFKEFKTDLQDKVSQKALKKELEDFYEEKTPQKLKEIVAEQSTG
ncbi:MAG: hypothetical protein M1536_05680 [Firmicutes bacterium]|nr:hypothetical protein [Bacillota bacterium]